MTFLFYLMYSFSIVATYHSSNIELVEEFKLQEIARIQKEAFDKKQHTCLVNALYHEARGEPKRGIKLVAQVIINRTKSNTFPNTICEVVNYKVNRVCAFSSCSKFNSKMKDRVSYYKVAMIADMALTGAYKHMTKASYFKVCSHESGFFNKLTFLGREGKHCFYH